MYLSWDGSWYWGIPVFQCVSKNFPCGSRSFGNRDWCQQNHRWNFLSEILCTESDLRKNFDGKYSYDGWKSDCRGCETQRYGILWCDTKSVRWNCQPASLYKRCRGCHLYVWACTTPFQSEYAFQWKSECK